MKKTTKYLAIGALVVGAFMFWVFGGDSEEAINNMDQTAGAESGDEYVFKTDEGKAARIHLPKCILNGDINNLTEKKEDKIFRSIYKYESGNSNVREIPDYDESIEEIVDDSSSVGKLFGFSATVQGNSEVAAYTYVNIDGDDSLDPVWIDDSYIGDEKYDLMCDDQVYYDVVYAGIYGTKPMFIAVNMEQ